MSDLDVFMRTQINVNVISDHPRYVEANAGCKHFDVHGGPEDIPVSRFSFDAQVYLTMLTIKPFIFTYNVVAKLCIKSLIILVRPTGLRA